MEAPRTQERILAGWAHDLGKPLQVIGSHARRLADEIGQDPQARVLARAIVALSDDALTLVDRLMESARTNEPRIVRPERLRTILKRVIAVVHGLHPGCALWIRSSIPEVEIELAGQLIAALVNLADNAVRASEPGQFVTIRSRLDADELKIDVIDRGRGMSNFVRQRAFEPYFSTWRTSRSTGLGLSESRAQIESIGGSIELESVEGIGTRATVILPAAG